MTILRLILGDQLSDSLPTLDQVDRATDIILLCEVMQEATYVKHHKKKIAFIFSAMRHFSERLTQKNYNVRYIKIDNPNNTQSFSGEVERAIKATGATRLVLTEPGEYRLLRMMQAWQEQFGVPVQILTDTRFLSNHEQFSAWAKDKKQLRMEFFYREMRQRHNILIEENGKPTGGQWNYDKENRKPPPSGLEIPKRIQHALSETTREVADLVNKTFADHFGTLEAFQFAVTREQALIELDYFIEKLLPNFGDYQDAMIVDEPYLFHSLISMYLNIGLLLPLEVCQKAQNAYRDGNAPLNATEGFIRQILGWREYIRGIYWYHMPAYADLNSLEANRPLPEFYWTTDTNMFCMAEALRHTRDHAYSHHIQRLMVTGNFALLAGLDVKEVQQWYLAVYADAYEWVEMPNTLGMALFGDGGIVASKPYAASGKYIDRMSNSCESCRYDPSLTIGDKACPFNSLYWDFIARHQDKLRGNQRMPYVLSTWDKFGNEKQMSIRQQALAVFQKIQDNQL
jgi:deoxyribodipyrimidine photolyase-related protein